MQNWQEQPLIRNEEKRMRNKQRGFLGSLNNNFIMAYSFHDFVI